MKQCQGIILFLSTILLLVSCSPTSSPPDSSIIEDEPSENPVPIDISKPKPLPVFHEISCKATLESTPDFAFSNLISSADGWNIVLDNIQEKEVAIQSLTLTFPTREVPETTTAKIKTAANQVECGRKIGDGRFEGCTSVVNYQIKGNEEFSLLFQGIDSATEIPSWRVKIGYKRDEPPTQTKDIKGNPITYFPTYEFEVECG